jgi:hypothetical protein
MEKCLSIVAIVAHDYVRAFVYIDNTIDSDSEIFSRAFESVAENACGTKVVENIDGVERRRTIDVKRQLNNMVY